MSKRKTQIDKAIEGLDHEIAALESQLLILRAARVRLVKQQQDPTDAKVTRIDAEGRG